MLYAVGQGALAVEVRSNDAEALELCKRITHKATHWKCFAERACLRVLEGGCSVPVGVSTSLNEADGILTMTACVTALDGSEHVEHMLAETVKSLEDAETVGSKMAKFLIESGARKILDDIKKIKEANTV
jgi:hydroxymethylbilane synthase